MFKARLPGPGGRSEHSHATGQFRGTESPASISRRAARYLAATESRLLRAAGFLRGHRRWVATILALGLAREGLVAQTATLTWRTRLAVHQSLLEAMVGRLHRLPLSFYRSEGVGAIMTRLERGVQGFVEAASQAAFGILPALVYLLIAIANERSTRRR